MLLRCRILRARGYTGKVLCAQRCERLLCHLSGSRDCVHCLSIDEEWSLHDAMLVHAFCFLQETVHAQRIRCVSGDPVRMESIFSFQAGGAGGGSPPLFSYLNMLFNDALVNISNFCNLYYISYIKKKTLKRVQGPYFACCCCCIKSS